jgi:RNA polymerase sigma-70 factor, ECF subfamily
MTAEEADDQLVGRAARGDKAAFAQLVARHQRRLLSLASRLAGSRVMAEDIVQDVFTRAWIKAPSWQARSAHGGSYAAWLSRIAVNLCIDSHRRRRPSDPDAIEDLLDTGANAEEMLLRQELATRVSAAVAALPERQRIAIGLFYDGELSNAEGAAAMEISVGAFELLLVRARRALRLAMGDG